MMRQFAQSFILVSLLVGCSPAIEYSTGTPYTLLDTMTPTRPSLPTLTIIHHATKDQHCPELMDETPLQHITTGTILLNHTAMSNTLFLHNLETGKEYKLPYISKKSVEYNGPGISPNRNMIAYPEALIEGDTRTTVLWVLDAHADILAKIPFDQPLDNLRWLDNERLVFYTPQTYKDGTVLVFNPFTKVQSIITNELPGLDISYTPGKDWLAEYSPDLQSVAYNVGLKTVVRNVVASRNVWEPKPPFSNVYKPFWSADGSKVAVGQNEKLFIIDRDGQANAAVLGISLFSWSPDGRYIAFWGLNGPSSYILMVYNTQLKTILNYCLEDVFPTTPLWSPNSKQIIVSINSDKGKPVLVDIQKNVIYKLTDTPDITYPLAWMNSLP